MRITTIHIIRKDTSLRNAARLFFYLKREVGPRFLMTDDLRLELSVYFSNYEIEKGLKVLKAHGWVGIAKTGRYFLRGQSFFSQKYSNSKRKWETDVPIPVLALLKKEQWRLFVAGATVAYVCNRMQKHVKQDVRDRYAGTPFVWGGPPTGVPMSASFLGDYVGVSKSTASRMRIAAEKAGFIKNRQSFQRTGIDKRFTLNEFVFFRSVEKMTHPEAKAMVLKKGRVWLQMPNCISVLVADFPKKRI